MRLLLLCIFLLGTQLPAQFMPARRMGSEDLPSEAAAHLLGTDQPVLGHFPATSQDQRRKFILTFFDSDFKEKSSQAIPLPEDYHLIHSFFAEESAWFLFWIGSLEGNYLLVEARDESFRMLEWEAPEHTFWAARLQGRELWILGEGKNDLILTRIRADTQEKAVWKVPLAWRTQIYEARWSEEEQVFEIIMAERDGPVKWLHWKPDGWVGLERTLELEPGKWPLSIQRQGDFWMGTFAEEKEGTAQGIFLTSDWTPDAIEYHRFLDVPGFWEAVEELETKGWGGNRKKRERNGLEGEYRILWRSWGQDSSWLMGEVARATYRLESYTDSDEFNRITIKYRNVFDGWLVTHGIAFSPRAYLQYGEIEVFEFDDIRTYQRTFRSHSSPTAIVFPHQGQLHQLELQNGKLREKSSTPVFEDERQTEGWATAIFALRGKLWVWGHRDVYKERTLLDDIHSKNFFFRPVTFP